MCDPGPGGGAGIPCDDAPRVYYGTPTPSGRERCPATFTVLQNLQLYALVDFQGGFLTEHGDIEAMHTAFRNSKAINERTDPILLAYDRLGIVAPVGYYKAGLREAPRGLGHLHLANADRSVVRRLPRVDQCRRTQPRLSLAGAEGDLRRANPGSRRSALLGSELSGYVQTVLPPFTQLLTTIRLAF